MTEEQKALAHVIGKRWRLKKDSTPWCKCVLCMPRGTSAVVTESGVLALELTPLGRTLAAHESRQPPPLRHACDMSAPHPWQYQHTDVRA